MWQPIAPATILEFGSGASTVHVATAFPEAHIFTIDHDNTHLSKTRELCKSANVKDKVTFIHSPLIKRRFGPSAYWSYSVFPTPSNIDCVLIDGPPYFADRGREACLYAIHDSLKIGGIVTLDDCRRLQEKKTIANWRSTFAGSFQIEEADVGHGLTFLIKTATTRARHWTPRRVADSLRRITFPNIIKWFRGDTIPPSQ